MQLRKAIVSKHIKVEIRMLENGSASYSELGAAPGYGFSQEVGLEKGDSS